jgi:hypothetical protein
MESLDEREMGPQNTEKEKWLETIENAFSKNIHIYLLPIQKYMEQTTFQKFCLNHLTSMYICEHPFYLNLMFSAFSVNNCTVVFVHCDLHNWVIPGTEQIPG